MVKRQTEIELKGKTVIRSGGANHFLNGEAVGGKLYLLDKSIVFQSHGFNLQNHGKEILLDNIESIDFYNTLGVITNGMKILMKENLKSLFKCMKKKIFLVMSN